MDKINNLVFVLRNNDVPLFDNNHKSHPYHVDQFMLDT